MRTIEFYRTRTGHCPVQEFLDSLTGKQAQKALWVLKLVEELNMVPRQYFKKLEDTEDIWEVRVQFGGDIFRLLGFFEHGALLILVSGFAKKTRKTPPQEIAFALQRKADHLSRRR
ncbi:MAG: type II toxin-antitoxin system RelE/ParE family toxin [Chloroflexi bacterium]|nr:type II toxin-antitoxin system RelE/ParE family toxin [Chloroflexota bacterium]